jgi:excisionase family DNA binding protein
VPLPLQCYPVPFGLLPNRMPATATTPLGVAVAGKVKGGEKLQIVKTDCPGDEPLLLRADEVAKMLGLGRTKVYEMTASGELPTVRIGTAVRVSRKALSKWIEERIEKAA